MGGQVVSTVNVHGGRDKVKISANRRNVSSDRSLGGWYPGIGLEDRLFISA